VARRTGPASLVVGTAVDDEHAELDTICRYQLPVVVAVMNDAALRAELLL